MCKDKGFVAVDPDNVDGYTNDSGFDLTASDQIAYNTWLADEAHAQGLAAGLKNDVDQLSALVSKFDFAVNEECYRWKECGKYQWFKNGASLWGQMLEVAFERATAGQ